MRRPTVPVDTRLSLLDNQAHAWADDEVWWHLSAIAVPKPKETAILDPLIAHTWLTAGTPAAVQYWASMQPRFNRIASVVLLDGHWTPCIWILRPAELEVILWEHDDVDINGLNCLHGLLSSVFGLPHFRTSCTRRQFGEQNCGAAAIIFLQHRLTGTALPETAAQLQDAADELREAFRQSMEGFNSGSTTMVLGLRYHRYAVRAQRLVATTWSANSCSPDQSQIGPAKHWPRCRDQSLEWSCTMENPEITCQPAEASAPTCHAR